MLMDPVISFSARAARRPVNNSANVIKLLGKGSFGRVYQVTLPSESAPRAFKTLSRLVFVNPPFLTQFKSRDFQSSSSSVFLLSAHC